MQFLKSIFEKFSKPKVDNYTEARQEKKLQGIIGYLGLEDLWYSLTEEEQEILTRYESSFCYENKEKFSLIKGDGSTARTCLDFILHNLSMASSEKQCGLADKIIFYAENNHIWKEDILNAHFYREVIAEYYYKLRDERENAIELSIKFCLEDINNFNLYSKKYFHVFSYTVPFIRTFYRLMIIYEKQGRYEEAIKYCEMAIKYGLEDNTKGGYKARLERLNKKLK